MIKEKKLVLRWMWHPPQVRNRVDGSIRRSRIGRRLGTRCAASAASAFLTASAEIGADCSTIHSGWAPKIRKVRANLADEPAGGYVNCVA